jgi:hypothetical protein
VAHQPSNNSEIFDDSGKGIRSLCISPDAKYLATGDRTGNLR